jgi:hypothetical protein
LEGKLDGYQSPDADDSVFGIAGFKLQLPDTDVFNISPSAMSTDHIENTRMVKGTVGFASYLLFFMLDIWLIISPVAV